MRIWAARGLAERTRAPGPPGTQNVRTAFFGRGDLPEGHLDHFFRIFLRVRCERVGPPRAASFFFILGGTRQGRPAWQLTQEIAGLAQIRSVLIDPTCGEPEVTCIREAQSANELPGPTGSGRKSGQMSPGGRSHTITFLRQQGRADLPEGHLDLFFPNFLARALQTRWTTTRGVFF